MDMNATPVNFKIPDDYDRLFMLMIGEFKYIIVADKEEIKSGSIEKTDNESAVLDFIEESISRVRYECEKLEKS